MSRSRLTVLPLLAVALFLSSCATQSGVEKRIEKNPQLYSKLSGSDRELVRRGEVKERMSQEAVFLAWGRPDQVMSGGRNGQSTEKWAYFSSRPVNNFNVGVGMGSSHSFYTNFGIHPRYGYSFGPGWNFGSSVDFVQQITKQVEFSNGRVTAWQRTQ
ncbi:MAG: hypothetical protein P1U58_07220 [Verrucomicrobiales bacterium]|nr:hypothetical protein [Verrucomicrobiales bacterium]